MECQKITKVSKNLQQNKSEKVTNDNDKEIPKDRYIPPNERQIIVNLRPVVIV